MLVSIVCHPATQVWTSHCCSSALLKHHSHNETFQKNVYLQRNSWLAIDFSLHVNDDAINLWCHLHKSLILELPDPFLPQRPSIYWRKRVGDARLLLSYNYSPPTEYDDALPVHVVTMLYQFFKANKLFMNTHAAGHRRRYWHSSVLLYSNLPNSTQMFSTFL